MRRFGPAAAASALLASLAHPTAASSPVEPFVGGSYLLRLEAAAIATHVDTAPRRLRAEVAHSSVNLGKLAGEEHGRCETVGAGARDSRIVHDSVEGAPSELALPGALDNRTEQRDTSPNLSPGDGFGRTGLRALPGRATRIPERGPAWHWAARCQSGASGGATADDGDLTLAQAAGSRTVAAIDTDLEYHGTAYAYVFGLRTGAAEADASSVMDVWRHPGREPAISYRMTVAGMHVARGDNVPLSGFAAQFDRYAATNPDAGALLRRLGLVLVGPTVDTSTDGNRRMVRAPYLELTHGQTTVRLMSTSFDGFLFPHPAA